jgi:hypothetical protein
MVNWIKKHAASKTIPLHTTFRNALTARQMPTIYSTNANLTNVQTIAFARGNICKFMEIGLSTFGGQAKP